MKLRPEYKALSIGVIHHGLFRLHEKSHWRCVAGYDGKKIPFGSAHEAIKAAKEVIAKLTEEKIRSVCPSPPTSTPQALDVERWRQDKAAEFEKLHDVFAGGARPFAVESRRVSRNGLTPSMNRIRQKSVSTAGDGS